MTNSSVMSRCLSLVVALVAAVPAGAQTERPPLKPAFVEGARLRLATRSQIWCSVRLLEWNQQQLVVEIAKSAPLDIVPRDSLTAVWVDMGERDPSLPERRATAAVVGLLVGGGGVAIALAARLPPNSDVSFVPREFVIGMAAIPSALLGMMIGLGSVAPDAMWERMDIFERAGPASPARIAEIGEICQNFNR
jgi:hypothetical protein